VPKIKKKPGRTYSDPKSPNWGNKTKSKSISKEFLKILYKVEKKRGITLLEHAIDLAYTNERVLIRILDKILPNITDDPNPNPTGVLVLGDLSNRELQDAIVQLLSVKAGRTIPPSKGAEHTESSE